MEPIASKNGPSSSLHLTQVPWLRAYILRDARMLNLKTAVAKFAENARRARFGYRLYAKTRRLRGIGNAEEELSEGQGPEGRADGRRRVN